MSHILNAALVLGVCVALVACSAENEATMVTSAKSFIAKNDYGAASIQLKNALSKNPESGEARYLLGKVLLAQGDGTAAIVELRKAQDAKFSDDLVLPELARALLATGEEARLVTQFADVKLQDAKAVADLSTSLAIAYAMRSEKDKARESADVALQAVPMYAPAVMVQARLKAGEGDVDGALFLLNEVLEREPGNDRAVVLKSDFLTFGKRDIEAAVATLRTGLKSQPDSRTLRSALVQGLLTLQKNDEARTEFALLKKAAPNHPETLYFEAQFAFNDQDFKKTREITEQVLKSFPNNVRVLELAGAAEFRLRNYLQAEALLSKALKLVPQQGLSRLLLAQTYLRTGEPAKTLDVLKPVLEGPRPDGATLSLAGEAYLQLGDAQRSEQAFQAALKAAPDDVRVRTSAALGQLARGNSSGAIVELEAVAAGDAGPRADLALVSARLRQNDFAGALKAIDGLQKKLPDQALPWQLRGRVQTLQNDVPGATKSFEAALAKEPAYFPAVASLAALDVAANKPEEARKRFNAFLQAQPKSWQVRMALAELEARVGAPAATVTAALREAVKAGPTEARPQVALIGHLLNTNDTKAALLAAQDASAALPNSTEVLEMLGRAELAAGDHQRALTSFRKLAGLQPRSATPELRLAETYAVMKDTEAAGRSLRRAAELQPDNLNIGRAQARLALAEGRPEDALRFARDLQKRKPQDATGFLSEGEIEVQRKNWDAAAAAYRTAQRLAPNAETAVKLHTSLMAANKAAEAERLAADWAKANPKDVSFNYFLGDVALAQNDLPRAEARYRAVLAVQPDNALALNNVAWLLAKQGKPGALAMAQKANQLLPDRAPLVDTLSHALEVENKLPEAIEAQKRAITLEPKDPSLTLRLAKLYIKAGDKTRARAELDTLARLGDQFANQAEVTQLLSTL